ncbi:hypothetical protein [Pediococcus pentosaceus]|uniref:hypothetical protein n=1 Tax=Pediococcus pentosaceus TaxID=1255 RepID=UPI001F50F242|nr:hypothetical protein [Pediococcus pentosaceus]
MFFKDTNILVQGIQMEAQSIGDNFTKFNVFIFNVQDSVKLTYLDGTNHVE